LSCIESIRTRTCGRRSVISRAAGRPVLRGCDVEDADASSAPVAERDPDVVAGPRAEQGSSSSYSEMRPTRSATRTTEPTPAPVAFDASVVLR